jgi:hypothetical protein
MTLDEFKAKIREIAPNANFDITKQGEIVIHTRLMSEDDCRPARGNREIIHHWMVYDPLRIRD